MPALSVIIPTYNRAIPLARTLSAIRQQTFKDWEILVIDDGSEDNTAEIVRTIADPRIRYIFQANSGVSNARNHGLAQAQGDIIVYCDSDDCLYPDALSVIASIYTDPAITYSICAHHRTLTLIDQNQATLATLDQTRPQAPATLQDYYNWDVKTTSSGMSHRREFFAGRVAWKSGFLIEDLEFLMQLAVLDSQGFRYIPDYLLEYGQVYGGNGLCSGASYADYAHAFGKIYELHKNDPLMTKPDVYLDRVVKYTKQHNQALAGEIPPPQLKYFPEFWHAP